MMLTLYIDEYIRDEFDSILSSINDDYQNGISYVTMEELIILICRGFINSKTDKTKYIQYARGL